MPRRLGLLRHTPKSQRLGLGLEDPDTPPANRAQPPEGVPLPLAPTAPAAGVLDGLLAENERLARQLHTQLRSIEHALV